MRHRNVIAAGALLAVAALSAALTPPGADAARPTRAADTALPVLTITVDSTKSSTTMSSTQLTPGNTVFDVSGKGSLEIVSLKSGYSIRDLERAGKTLFAGKVKTVRKVDKNVTFWGGMPGGRGGAQFGVDLPAGSFYAVNLDRGNYVPFTVAGTPESRALPESGGTVKMVHDMTFKADRTLPNKGWLLIDNKATEPHFVVFNKIKKGTKASTVAEYFMNGAQGQPSWAEKESYDIGIVSPGKSFVASIDTPRGDYAELCFWPSKRTGAPHAFMGMVDVSTLK